jgi:hypothetical protein
MCEDFAPNFEDKRTVCYILTTHRLTLPFPLGNFRQKNNMTVVPHPPYSPDLAQDFSVSRHFGKVEVIEAESQAVLNTLAEHGFQDAFKKW